MSFSQICQSSEHRIRQKEKVRKIIVGDPCVVILLYIYECDTFRKPAAKKKKTNSKTSTNDIRKHLIRGGDSTIAGTATSQCTAAQDESDGETKENKDATANMKNYKQFFRELDWDIWVMLSLPLTLEPEPEQVTQLELSFERLDY